MVRLRSVRRTWEQKARYRHISTGDGTIDWWAGYAQDCYGRTSNATVTLCNKFIEETTTQLAKETVEDIRHFGLHTVALVIKRVVPLVGVPKEG